MANNLPYYGYYKYGVIPKHFAKIRAMQQGPPLARMTSKNSIFKFEIQKVIMLKFLRL
ncbi:hypothetical protein [Rickettsia endosymbiont of Ceutorhynchus obstrictus]|uniref:hypothetical protein n=1 Tax=Rickettsia endosymbiont of Ceutorhynchus obstrictus TaxID=3066249 RepID=UPI0031332341